MRAQRAVLADVPAPHLYRSMVGEHHLSARLRRDLDRFDWDNATVKVNWALSAPVPWRSTAAAAAGTVHLGGGLDDLSRTATDLATGTVPLRPFVLLGPDDVHRPVPVARRHRVGLGLRAPAARRRRSAAEVEAVRRPRSTARSSGTRPGSATSSSPAACRARPTCEAADPSLDGGALNGGTAALHQQLVFRPTPGLGRPDTPVRRAVPGRLVRAPGRRRARRLRRQRGQGSPAAGPGRAPRLRQHRRRGPAAPQLRPAPRTAAWPST